MKKNNLLKVILITFLVIILLSCFVKPSTIDGTKVITSEVNSIGILGFANVFYSSLLENLDTLVLVIMVGIMYGVLNKTNAYQKLVSCIAEKFKNKEKWILFISILFFALMTSIFGLQLELFIFVPLFGAVLMKAGYDNKTVFASTIGSILIGMLGATFNSTIIGSINAYYGFDYIYQIGYKAFILAIVLFLYIVHVLKYANLEANNIEYLDIPNYEEPSTNKRKVLPVIIYILVLLVLTVFGVFKLGDIIGFEIFTNIKEALMSITFVKNILGDVPIFSTLGYIDLAYMLFISSLFIGFIYGIKIDDMIDGMYKGAKRVLAPALILLAISTIPTIASNYPFYLTIADKVLSFFENFNIFISSVATFITAVFVPNISLGAAKLLPLVNATMTSDINAFSLIIQTIYGLVLLVAPTSALLMLGLSYYKINYTEWFKYIFKLFLYVFIVLMAIFIIVVLI